MTRDAVYQPLPRSYVEKWAAKMQMPIEKAQAIFDRQREKLINSIKGNPYENGFVPPIWIVVKTLLRNSVVTNQDRKIVKSATGLAWEEFAERMRTTLGFAHTVNEAIIMGANRSGKTDFAARFSLQTAMQPGKLLKIGFQELKTGKEVQMKRMWHYMPNDKKRQNIALKRATSIHEHISYSEANGFAGSRIVFANGSNIDFFTYKMDVKAVGEGMEEDLFHLDEEAPKEFLDAARGRVASRGGVVLLTFTPISGYTPVVADYLNDMQVTRWHVAYMLPRDGGPALPWRELGLSESEYETLRKWRQEKGPDPCIPEARPENCLKWIEGGTGEELEADIAHRAFVTTPRVAVCKNGEAAAIWFYGSDNPYGTPMEVIANAAKNLNAIGEIKKRVYGIAERLKGRLMPEFSRERNVVKDGDVPKKLARIMIVDPAPDRNWTFGWMGFEPETGKLFKYREWPSSFEIPGVGVPGPWATVDDKRKNGINDGKKGDAQESFGMGFDHYKFEVARLERWKCYVEWEKSQGLREGECPKTFPENIEELVSEWSELGGAGEMIVRRIIDPRAAANRKTTATENITLFEEMAKRLENLEPGSGQQIDVGLNVIRGLIVTGKYQIAENCTNTIFTWENYCGVDGQKGACKDFADTDRYGVLSGVTAFTAEDATEHGETRPLLPSFGGGRRRKRAGGL